MEQRDDGDCTPDYPHIVYGGTQTDAAMTDHALSHHAADARAALRSYQLVAALRERTTTGMESLTYAHLRREAETCIRIVERAEARRAEPGWVPPRMPTWFLTDEELERWR